MIALRAFTLLEAVVTIVVLSIVAAVVLPVVNAAADAYGASSTAERAVDDSVYAMDRVTRLLREAPMGATYGQIGVTELGDDRVVFSDGSGCRLQGDELQQRASDGSWDTLCDQVETFELDALTATGDDASSDPTQVQLFQVRLVRAGFELRSAAFCRARYGT